MLTALALFALGRGHGLAAAPPVLELNPESHAGIVSGTAFCDHDRGIVSVAGDGSLRLHKIGSHQVVSFRTPVAAATETSGAFLGTPTCVTALSSGQIVAGVEGIRENVPASVVFLNLDGTGFRKVSCFPSNSGAPGEILTISPSSDGKRIVAAGVGRNGSLVTAGAGTPSSKDFSVVEGLKLPADELKDSRATGSGFSPDGRQFALAVVTGAGEGRPKGLIRVFDSSRLQSVRDIPLPGLPLGVAWTRKSTLFALVQGYDANGPVGGMKVYALTSAPTPLMDATALAVSPDGSHLAVARPDGSIAFCDADGKVESQQAGPGTTVASLAISEDNSKIAIGDGNGGVNVISRGTEAPIYANAGKTISVSRLTWNSSDQLDWSGIADGRESAFRFTFSSGKLGRVDSVAARTDARGQYRIERNADHFKLLDQDGKTILEADGDADWCGDDFVCLRPFVDGQIHRMRLVESKLVRAASSVAPPGAMRIACSPDGKNIAVGYDNGTIRIFSRDLGASKLALFATLDDEWVAFNEASGLFDCSLRGASLFGFVRYESEDALATFLPAEGWMNTEYHHPGLAREAIGTSAQGSPPDNVPLQKAAETAPSPIELVKIDGEGAQKSDSAEWTVKSPRIDVYYRVKALPRDARVNVALGSGNIISKSAGDSAVPADPDVYRHGLTLEPGANYVTLTYTAPDGVKSTPVLVTVVYNDGKPSYGTFRIFAVGVDDFEWDGLAPLKSGEDAGSIANLLKDPAFSPESDIALPVVLPGHVTKQEFEDALTKFLAGVKSGDRVLIYVSTHGVVETDDQKKEQLCFVLSDTKKDKGLTTGMRWEDVKERVRKVACKSVTFLVDVCYSGRATAEEETQGNAFRSGGFAVFSSSLSAQASAATRQGHGIFSLALMDVLKSRPVSVIPDKSDTALPSPYVTVVSLLSPVAQRMKAYFVQEGGAGAAPIPRFNWEAANMPLMRWASSSH